MTEEFKKIDESLLEEDFDDQGFYVDANGDLHIANWKKIEMDLATSKVLTYLKNGGNPHGNR